MRLTFTVCHLRVRVRAVVALALGSPSSSFENHAQSAVAASCRGCGVWSLHRRSGFRQSSWTGRRVEVAGDDVAIIPIADGF